MLINLWWKEEDLEKFNQTANKINEKSMEEKKF